MIPDQDFSKRTVQVLFTLLNLAFASVWLFALFFGWDAERRSPLAVLYLLTLFGAPIAASLGIAASWIELDRLDKIDNGFNKDEDDYRWSWMVCMVVCICCLLVSFVVWMYAARAV